MKTQPAVETKDSKLQKKEISTVLKGGYVPLPAKELKAMEKKIEKVVASYMKKLANGPGCAVMATKDGKLIVSAGYGFANIKTKTKIDVSTLFDLASMSKQATALCVLLLQQRGTIDLSAPIEKYISSFKQPYPARPVTSMDLLHHFSGLPSYTDADYEEDEFKNLTLDKFISWLNTQKPNGKPGKKYEYNNTNYCLLALLVQRVSGMPFSEFLKLNVFAPCGMTKTIVVDSWAVQPGTGQRAEGYCTGKPLNSESLEGAEKHAGVCVSRSDSIMCGDGNMFTCIEDISKYEHGLRTLLLKDPQARKAMFEPGRLDNGKVSEGSYGFGWEIIDIEEDPLAAAQHNGNWSGTSTAYRHYVRIDRSIVVLSNDECLDALSLVNDIDVAMDDDE